MADQDIPSAAEVQEALTGLDFPASKDDVLKSARNNGAEDNVINFLEHIPEQEFTVPTDISQALGDYIREE
jgi:hypothetical protein